ncbi:ABC transporter substrate-binding protein [Cohnella cellulosilytica]|uniref:ABC transporter substrate-binding protein n=2 Tax=Cohnella cellulosilytica TaxID=986710 RepID=A0ABW2FCW2_9BACL
MLLWIAGCGGTNAGSGSSAPSEKPPVATVAAPPAESPSGSGAEPMEDPAAVRIFTDAIDRQVEVPVKPERIVSLEFTGYLHALGVKPVATSPRFFLPPFAEFMEGAEDLGYPANLEKLAGIEPDLIIAPDYVTQDQMDAFEKIAPVVLLKWSETNNLNRLTMLADLLDRHDEERQWLDSYKRLAEQTREKLRDYVKPGESAAVFYAWSTSINVLAPQVISTLYDDIGFEPTEKMKQRLAAEPDFASETISKELLSDYAADRMFFIAEGELGKELLADLKKNVLSTVPAFREDKVYVLDPNWYSFEPTLLEWQLNNAVEVLAE